jgi:hypothetical protein
MRALECLRIFDEGTECLWYFDEGAGVPVVDEKALQLLLFVDEICRLLLIFW